MARLERTETPGNRLHFKTPEPSPGSPLPAFSRDLIQYLEVHFPNSLPTPTAAFEEAVIEMAKGWGRLEVIEHLKELLREIEEQNHVYGRTERAPGRANPSSTAGTAG